VGIVADALPHKGVNNKPPSTEEHTSERISASTVLKVVGLMIKTFEISSIK
jgi:hypothetical protein